MTTDPVATDPVTPVSVLVVDDNPVVRSGLLALLELDSRLHVVGEASNGQQAVSMARALRPDVTLLDVQMPRRDGISAAQELTEITRVLMMTFSDTPEVIHAAIDAGATGYLVHGTFAADELVACVLATAAGNGVFGAPALAALRTGRTPAGPQRPDHDLSPRQVEIMEQIATGGSNADIARELFLAEKTVKNHVNHIFGRLGVRSRAEAVALWLGGTAPDRLKPL
jgi:DNA-binding NarL/FixJ family response regulator